MKIDTVIDVPKIQKEIREIHKDFMETYGDSLDKTIADSRLFADIMFSRIYRVAVCFKEEGVIDDFIVKDGPPLKSIRLSKSGYDNTVKLVTNGRQIAIEGIDNSISDSVSSDRVFRKVIYNAQKDDYDWTDFGRELIDCIHTVIYERKNASETHINQMLRTP